MSGFSLRKASLGLLQHLGTEADMDISGIAGSLSVNESELEHIISRLHSTGVIETGFSLIELADDQVLIDVLKGLYYREISREPAERVRDLIIGERHRIEKSAETPFFDITIPAVPKSELIAVKSLEQIAVHYNIPEDITGQLQFALVELFTGILAKDIYMVDSYDLKFRMKENIFHMEIILPVEEFTITAEDSHYIREYIDGLKVERILQGVKITLLKELSEDFDFAPAP